MGLGGARRGRAVALTASVRGSLRDCPQYTEAGGPRGQLAPVAPRHASLFAPDTLRASAAHRRRQRHGAPPTLIRCRVRLAFGIATPHRRKKAPEAQTRRGSFQRSKTSAKASATTATAVAAKTTTAATVTLATGGEAVDAGAGRVGLAAGLDRLAAWQVELGELRGLERVDVARQFVTIATRAAVTAVLVAVTALAAIALTLALTFGARAARMLRAVLTLALSLTLAIVVAARGLVAV